MKNRFFSLALLLLFLLQSCDKSVKTYDLTVVVSDNLSNGKDDKYPDELQALCYPLVTSKNYKYNYCPNAISVLRLSSPSNLEQRLNIIADEKKSNTSNMNYRKNMAVKYFLDNPVPKIFRDNNPPDFVSQSSLKNFLLGIGKKSTAFFYAKESLMDSCFGKRIYDNLDSLKRDIVVSLDGSTVQHVFVFYNPTLSVTPRVDSTTVVVAPTKTTQDQSSETKSPDVKTTPSNKSQSTITTKSPGQGSMTGTISNKTQGTLSGGKSWIYKGEITANKPNGLGMMTYYVSMKLAPNTDKMSEPNDYVSGSWTDGDITAGKWFNVKGELKEVLLIGQQNK